MVATLAALAADGTIEPKVVEDAIEHHGIDVEAADPRAVDLTRL